MGSWCCENLRDLKGWESEGLKMSSTSNEAVKLYDATLRQLVSWIDCEQLGGIMETTDKMIEAEPDSIICRSLALGMDALGTNRKLDTQFSTELDNLVKDAKKNGNNREQKHALAVSLFANGEMSKAINEWETILDEYPTDLQAVKFSHDAYFFSGKREPKLATINRVIKKWTPNLPCSSYLYGMQAFAFEENEQYAEAEESAKTALNIQCQDAWAVHAFAHCKEMQGQFEEGINFMESSVKNWEPCWMLACHNFWHTALFYLEKADYESVLSIFDSEIAKRSQSKFMLDLVDAASMLSRLEMEGVEVGKERWSRLVPLVEDQIESHVLAFNDAHISMILANSSDEKLQKKHFDSIGSFIGSQSQDNENRRVTEFYGQKICEAIAAYNQEKFDQCFELLYRIRHQIYQIGGSNAQRDVFSQFLLNSGFKSTCTDHKNKALEAFEERKKLKPNSLVADRILQRHKQTAH